VGYTPAGRCRCSDRRSAPRQRSSFALSGARWPSTQNPLSYVRYGQIQIRAFRSAVSATRHPGIPYLRNNLIGVWVRRVECLLLVCVCHPGRRSTIHQDRVPSGAIASLPPVLPPCSTLYDIDMFTVTQRLFTHTDTHTDTPDTPDIVHKAGVCGSDLHRPCVPVSL
jgi:hypothetical protein